jgi:putative two-component system response regulator
MVSNTPILIVDDELNIRRLLQAVLARTGNNIFTAESALEASSVLSQVDIALVLLDIEMPGKSGIEFLPEIATGYHDTAVIIATANMDINVAIACMKQGAYDYINKPFHAEEVLFSVNRALEKRRLELEIRDYRRNLEEKVAAQAAKLRSTFMNAITSLVNALEAKDMYTAGHSRRVAELSAQIAREMGLPQNKIDIIRLAGQLHDIGKIGVKESILNKPGGLTDDEVSQIQYHSETGERILAPITDNSELLMSVRSHHERYDGSGYPDHLSKDRIPLGARILAVADAYEAMTSKRPYRDGMDRVSAIMELERGCGKQFDSEVVAFFKRVVYPGVVNVY